MAILGWTCLAQARESVLNKTCQGEQVQKELRLVGCRVFRCEPVAAGTREGERPEF
jgi:hypothetical protein